MCDSGRIGPGFSDASGFFPNGAFAAKQLPDHGALGQTQSIISRA
jgi:hypothetical protein